MWRTSTIQNFTINWNTGKIEVYKIEEISKMPISLKSKFSLMTKKLNSRSKNKRTTTLVEYVFGIYLNKIQIFKIVRKY